jgi:site-specific DNA-methyltransferase (adenine-specific)
MKSTDILFNDHFQNFKRYQIPKAQLIIADMPYNLGNNAYASNPSWYKDGDNKNGESELAGTEFFDTDKDFRPAEFMHFCSQMLKKEPKEKCDAPCMIVFCEYEQQFYLIELARRYGIMNYINLVFRKNFSAQVLKANMKVVGNCEYGLLLYRDKLPKFRNEGKMIFNCIDWEKDNNDFEKIHPTQKPVKLIKKLINIFTDENDVVIDPVAGSGSSIIAGLELNRKSFGFEIKKYFYRQSCKWIDYTLDKINNLKTI